MGPRQEAEHDDGKLKQADPEGLYLFALEDYPYMMTPDQVAEFTGISSQGVRKVLTRGEMSGCRIGNRWLIPKLALLRYLNQGCESRTKDAEAADGTSEVR